MWQPSRQHQPPPPPAARRPADHAPACAVVRCQVWRPGVDPLGEDEELDYDPTAYDCLHKFSLEWPCLSFDLLRDGLGGPRSTFPHSLLMVAGTQAASARQNYLAVLQLADLGQGRHGKRPDKRPGAGDSSSDEDDDESSEDESMDGSDDEDGDGKEPPARMHHRCGQHAAPLGGSAGGNRAVQRGRHAAAAGTQLTCASRAPAAQAGEPVVRHQPRALLPAAAGAGGNVGRQRVGAAAGRERPAGAAGRGGGGRRAGGPRQGAGEALRRRGVHSAALWSDTQHAMGAPALLSSTCCAFCCAVPAPPAAAAQPAAGAQPCDGGLCA